MIADLDIDWSAYDYRSWHWLDYLWLQILTLALVLIITGLDIDPNTYDYRSWHWLECLWLQVLTLTRLPMIADVDIGFSIYDYRSWHWLEYFWLQALTSCPPCAWAAGLPYMINSSWGSHLTCPGMLPALRWVTGYTIMLIMCTACVHYLKKNWIAAITTSLSQL